MNFARNQFYFCTEKAFGENYDASEETENARAMAAAVKSKSDEIKCYGASIEADNAANNFIIAKENFREASNYLKTVKTTEDKNEAYNSIASAKVAIEEAIKYLNLALKNLSDALSKLEECK
jgi:predicted S18 family serine protease